MGSQNPRKFAEKIALLQQKEREHSEQFNSILQEVRETKAGGHYPGSGTAGGVHDFPRMPYTHHSMPNLQQVPSNYGQLGAGNAQQQQSIQYHQAQSAFDSQMAMERAAGTLGYYGGLPPDAMSMAAIPVGSGMSYQYPHSQHAMARVGSSSSLGGGGQGLLSYNPPQHQQHQQHHSAGGVPSQYQTNAGGRHGQVSASSLQSHAQASQQARKVSAPPSLNSQHPDARYQGGVQSHAMSVNGQEALIRQSLILDRNFSTSDSDICPPLQSSVQDRQHPAQHALLGNGSSRTDMPGSGTVTLPSNSVAGGLHPHGRLSVGAVSGGLQMPKSSLISSKTASLPNLHDGQPANSLPYSAKLSTFAEQPAGVGTGDGLLSFDADSIVHLSGLQGDNGSTAVFANSASRSMSNLQKRQSANLGKFKRSTPSLARNQKPYSQVSSTSSIPELCNAESQHVNGSKAALPPSSLIGSHSQFSPGMSSTACGQHASDTSALPSDLASMSNEIQQFMGGPRTYGGPAPGSGQDISSTALAPHLWNSQTQLTPNLDAGQGVGNIGLQSSGPSTGHLPGLLASMQMKSRHDSLSDFPSATAAAITSASLHAMSAAQTSPSGLLQSSNHQGLACSSNRASMCAVSPAVSGTTPPPLMHNDPIRHYQSPLGAVIASQSISTSSYSSSTPYARPSTVCADGSAMLPAGGIASISDATASLPPPPPMPVHENSLVTAPYVT